MPAEVETLVVGAGAVGLAIARAMALAGHEVMVLDQHQRVGAETSSRNSEVIHAGLYYDPGSLKARLCVEGNRLLYAFAAENGVGVRKCGKLLIATDETETARLEAIAATAAANGITDLAKLSTAEARTLEPAVHCVAAYLSPSTGIVESHDYLQALEGHIAAAGGSIVLNTRVTGLRLNGDATFTVETDSAGENGEFSAQNLILAAGLDATRLGRLLTYRDNYAVPETFLAKGHYFTLAGAAPFQHLVYPMPAKGSLGIHFTRDTGGGGKFGPDIEWKGPRGTGPLDYSFEDASGSRHAAFEAAIRRFWPGLPDNALVPGYTGLRPKLTREGEPVADFAIHGKREHGVANLIALYGIESPGLTSSLAIGAYVTGLMRRA